MKFSKSELDIIYQYAAPTKAETLAGMKETVPVIKDLLTKAIVENAIRKLEKIPEPECSQFVAATKARFLAERDNSIRQRLAAAKAQEPILQGHDLSGIERFHPETRHMITLEVQNALVNKNWTLKLYFLTYNLYYFTAAYVSLYCLGVKYPREYAGRSSLKNFIYAAISSSIFSPCR